MICCNMRLNLFASRSLPMRALAVLTAAMLSAAAAPVSAAEGPVPTRVGQCVATRIAELSSRLENMPDSGSAVSYVNGIYQVSYDMIPGMVSARVGDSVKLCLTSLPADCPKGDDRGKTYSATDLRTKKSWEAMDSEHMCGGA
jgi:hypothetical protein